MPVINVIVQTDISRSGRVRQLESMFDVPAQERQTLKWHGEIPYDDKPWNIGLIVGPSGCGKSIIARHLFGDRVDISHEWKGKSVIDDFNPALSMEDIATICQSVGFNTIPAWMRPYNVLSNGEKFRVDVARRLLEYDDPIVIDEFTSVVDRQVAQIGCHAIQKIIRKRKRQFVAVACHYDIIEWLQPDWIFEPGTMTFQWRCLQPRPKLNIEISRVEYEAWQIFAPFHYLTRELNTAAVCYGLWVEGILASFMGVLHFPHPKVKNIKRDSRLVTLPDYQGLGLAYVLSETVASAYKALGYRFRNYPAHPALIHGHDKSPMWAMVKRPGTYLSAGQKISGTIGFAKETRPCAVFEYIGPAMDKDIARNLIEAR